MYNKDAHSSVDNIQYHETKLSKKGETWQLVRWWMPQAQSWSPLYNDMLKPFSFDNYLSPRLPIDLGPLDTKKIEECPRVLRLTIKEEGSLKVCLPQELQPIAKEVRRLLDYEFSVNPNLKDFNVHLTLDHGKVTAGQTQRFPGWHGDGLQGGKFPEKLVCEHSYIVASGVGPEICLQPFFLKHIDQDVYNLFKAFDQQAKAENVYQTLPDHVYLMDPYVVHRTPLLEKDMQRNFLRLTIANAELPIEFNTQNPMLQTQKAKPKLDIRDHLLPPDVPLLYSQYGLQSVQEETVEKNHVPHQSLAPFEEAKLSSGDKIDFAFKGFPRVQPNSPTYRDIHDVFNPLKYTNPRLPIDLGKTDSEAIKKCPNVLRMMLKWTNSRKVHIPKELRPIKPLLARLFVYEQNINPRYKEMAAHITIDVREVEPKSTQRFPGWHGDDLQGGAFQPKVQTAHSYIVTTSPTTELCLQPFFVAHLDDCFEKVFDEFNRQARESNVVKVKDSHVYLVDPYNVHRSPIISQPATRVFLRVTFSPPEMLLPHDTKNPMFDYTDYPGDNAVHLDESWFLVPSDKAVPFVFYGLKNLENL